MKLTLTRKDAAITVAIIIGTVTIALLNYYWITNHDLGSSITRAVILGVIAVAVFRTIAFLR